MKNSIFLVALCLCLNVFAKERIVTYKIKTGQAFPATIICKGNFNKGILSDGPVEFYSPTGAYRERIILRGNYVNSTFTGTIKCGKVGLECYGNIYNVKNQIISAKTSATDWTIRLQFTGIIGFDFPIASISIEDQFFSETHRTGSIIREENLSWINLRKYVYNKYADPNGLCPIQDATISFTNGNKYTGPIYRNNGEWQIGRFDAKYNIWGDPKPFEIKYWWPNGDYFEGRAYRFEDREDQIIPTYGIVKYQDGSIDSSWAIHKNLEDYSKLFTIETTPTQLRDKIQAIEAQEQEKALAAEQERARKKALQEERLRKQQAQQNEAKERKQTLIQKYGAKWGESLATGKLELGMTQQMCQEVINIKSYDIGKSIRSGHRVETWTFNKDKQDMQVAAAMTQLSGEEAMALALLMGFADSVGASTPKYSILVFTDGKLTSLY